MVELSTLLAIPAAFVLGYYFGLKDAYRVLVGQFESAREEKARVAEVPEEDPRK